jgi:hypothetical protein
MTPYKNVDRYITKFPSFRMGQLAETPLGLQKGKRNHSRGSRPMPQLGNRETYLFFTLLNLHLVHIEWMIS